MTQHKLWPHLPASSLPHHPVPRRRKPRPLILTRKRRSHPLVCCARPCVGCGAARRRKGRGLWSPGASSSSGVSPPAPRERSKVSKGTKPVCKDSQFVFITFPVRRERAGSIGSAMDRLDHHRLGELFNSVKRALETSYRDQPFCPL